MFQGLFERLLAQFITPDRVKEVAEVLRRAGYRAIDMAIAALVTAVLAYLNRPSDEVILGASYYCLGDTPAQAVGSSALIFGIISAIRYLAPILIKLFFVFIVALGMAGAAQAGSIEGSLVVPEHRLVRLNAKVDEGSRVFWFVFPAGKADIDLAGNSLRFVGPPGRYDVYLNEIPKDESRPVSQTFTSVEIQHGSNPSPGPAPPPPGPVPPPPPLPPGPLPDGEFRLAAWAAAEGAKINDVTGARLLAGSFKGIAAAFAAATVRDVDQLKKMIRKSIDERGAGWVPFRQALQAELNRQSFNARTTEAWMTALREIAVGLESLR